MAEHGRTEQIISQLQSKTIHAVLSSRIPSFPRLSDPDPIARTRRRDRWFNLALGDIPSSLETPGAAMDPTVIDILLTGGSDAHVVERWSATCHPPPPPNSSSDGSLYRKTYKKSIVLLRSLYSVLRLLPCFRIFRMLSSGRYNYDLSYQVSSFAEPFSRAEEKSLKYYHFTPVETEFGYISVSVTYRADLSGFNFEAVMPTPTMIITDWVGSPAADPVRSFPPSPSHRPPRGHQPSSSLPTTFQRPHSWNAVQMEGQRRKGFSSEEFLLSPPFSPSPTPSPPMYGSGNSLQARMRLETAPVSIPMGLSGKGQLYRMTNHSDPARSFLPPPSPRSTRMDHSSQESPTSEGRSFRKSEALKVSDFYSNLHLYAAQKGLKDGRDDSGRFSGGFSSSGSPRFGFSRSSSRLSIPDDLDDGDFSCPFAVDDVDTSDSQTRNLEGKEVPESPRTFSSSHKSQDAAVGALVHMLRTAPPLREDNSYLSQSSSRSDATGEAGQSSMFKSQKSSDALMELSSYRRIKDIIVSQSRSQLLDSAKRSTD